MGSAANLTQKIGGGYVERVASVASVASDNDLYLQSGRRPPHLASGTNQDKRSGLLLLYKVFETQC